MAANSARQAASVAAVPVGAAAGAGAAAGVPSPALTRVTAPLAPRAARLFSRLLRLTVMSVSP